MKKKEIGQKGEDLACEFLRKKGYQILERNFKRKWGELDIVAFDKKNKILVLVEVKTFQKEGNLRPEDELTFKKLKNFKKSALFYANSFLASNELKGWRLDLLTIILEPQPVFNHFENIF